MASNVDFQFIEEQEGFKLDGYVPLDKDGNPLGKSGVTIASGFDAGRVSARNAILFQAFLMFVPSLCW